LTPGGYCDLLDTIECLDLVEHVSPIQLAIRLLVTQGSRLLELADLRALVGAFDPETLAYPWSHPDAGVDDLQREVMALVGTRLTTNRRTLFDAVSALAHDRAGILRPGADARPARHRSTVPYLNEPWYC
jgi:hypothetical protein